MIISRVWCMPSKWTFSMKPVRKLISKYITSQWVDPFSGKFSPADITNDIESEKAVYHMDALEFLKMLEYDTYQGAFFDPPYSVEQCLRLYTPKYKGTVGRLEYWSKCKDQISRILKPNGIFFSFCWDSCGMGQKRGFQILEILLICHGGSHNDTIVTIEKKTKSYMTAIKLSEDTTKKFKTYTIFD